MTTHLRTFIAVELPTECIEFIETLQSRLKAISPDVKWVKPSHCHITLKFLGNVPADTIPAMIGQIQTSLENVPAFCIETTTIGAFPSLQRPEVLWIGVTDEQKKLAQLAGHIETTLISLGFPPEKRAFSAHITFARTRPSKKTISWAHALSLIHKQPLIITVDHVLLYQSVLSSQGPEYILLHRWSLK